MKIIAILITLFTLSFAELKSVYPDMELINSGIKIIDVRTSDEWRSGIIKDSILITFFDKNGKYNMEDFLEKLHEKISIGEEFALICRSGNRSSTIGSYLDALGYNVVNIKGGIKYVKALGLPIVNPDHKEFSSLEELEPKH